MTAVDVLTAHGIVRAAEVVELATATGLELACACVLLAKESGGGRNVWGHDPVPTANAYVKGHEVTSAAYGAYLAAVRAGSAGRQGVGPTQLTYGPFQDQADALGGCWDWRANCRVGFGVLAALIRQNGEREGFRRYNGAGPAAEAYADDAMTRLAVWRAQLRSPSSSPAPQEVDVPLTPQEIQAIADAVWRRPTRNGWGDIVEAQQVVIGTEVRAADVQAEVHKTVPPAPAAVAAGGVDLDALADRVVDRLAKRLGGV